MNAYLSQQARRMNQRKEKLMKEQTKKQPTAGTDKKMPHDENGLNKMMTPDKKKATDPAAPARGRRFEQDVKDTQDAGTDDRTDTPRTDERDAGEKLAETDAQDTGADKEKNPATKTDAQDEGKRKTPEMVVEVHALAVAVGMIPRVVLNAAMKAGAKRDEQGRLWLEECRFAQAGKFLMRSFGKMKEAAMKTRPVELGPGEEWLQVVAAPPNTRLVYANRMRDGLKAGSRRVVAVVRKGPVRMMDEVKGRLNNGSWEVQA